MTETVELRLHIENRYEDGSMVVTHRTVHVPPPPPESDVDDYDEWAWEFVHVATGTGRTTGEAWYDVTITAASDPRLAGRLFAFGY